MDADLTARFATLLRSDQTAVIDHWHKAVAARLNSRQTEAELTAQIRELHQALVAAASAGGALSLAGPESAELRSVLAELSARRARLGFNPTETAVSVFALKDALLSAMAAEDADALRDYLAFAGFVDEMGLFTFETYAAARDELIAEQAQQLMELSTPVVKLWDGVVAVPLVGTLDSARAQVVMERLLQALSESGSPFAIIDITGVAAVDTQVAQHILKTVVAARLMGADCMISGIRPQIAQTMVTLGIEFTDIITKASLADALAHALRARGIEVSSRATGRTAAANSKAGQAGA